MAYKSTLSTSISVSFICSMNENLHVINDVVSKIIQIIINNNGVAFVITSNK